LHVNESEFSKVVDLVRPAGRERAVGTMIVALSQQHHVNTLHRLALLVDHPPGDDRLREQRLA
jgi:hypothetical protein